MRTAVLLIIVTAVTLVGDYFIKVASGRPNGLWTPTFAIGLVLYGLPAIGWFYLMRSHALSVIGVLYSAATVLLLTGLSIFVFKEGFGWREALGVMLALLAVTVVGLK